MIAKITAFATSLGFSRGIYLTDSLLSTPAVVRISFSTKPGLIFYGKITILNKNNCFINYKCMLFHTVTLAPISKN